MGLQIPTTARNSLYPARRGYPSGLTKTATPQGGQELKMYYNLQGKRTHLYDPDAGLIRTEYNGFGELTKEVQKIKANADSIITTNYYDNLGRLTSINRNGEITTYNFDNNIKDRVNSIVIEGKHQQTFGYDEFGRVESITEDIITNGVAKTYKKTKEYDVFGRVKKEIFPTGYYTVNTYDKYSNLIETKDGAGRQIWKAVAENARGQLTEAQKGGRNISYGFDTRGLPGSIQSTGIIDLEYQFNSKCNLEYRIEKHATSGGQSVVHREDFKYDVLNRLYEWEITQTGATTAAKTSNIVYNDVTGTITSKSDLGAFTFGYGINNTKPHALASISGVPASFPQSTVAYPLANLDVTYTDFKKIKTLSEMGKTYELTYGVDDQRRKSVQTINGYTKTRYYVGDYEEETDNAGNIKKIHYLSGAVYISSYMQGQLTETLYYTYADYQGSLIALTDENGTVVERYAYDPWGARRNPDNWAEKDNRTSWIVNRGYTGHEHLDTFGIINMNGRVFDPLTAMFFSPDPYVQSPDNWVNYNRYGYCLNNPLKYTDPSGDRFFLWQWLFYTSSGYEFQKTWLPFAFHKIENHGDEVDGSGWEISVGIPYFIPISYRYHYAEINYNKYYDNSYKGKMIVKGGEWSAGLWPIFRFTYGSNEYIGVDDHTMDQTTNYYYAGNSLFNIRFEDDYDHLGWDLPGIDHGSGDKFRTSAGEINFFGRTMGFKLMTGEATIGFHEVDGIKFNNEINAHRLGLIYWSSDGRYKGINSENIRDLLQNRLIHLPRGFNLWDVLNIPPRGYSQSGSSGGSSLRY